MAAKKTAKRKINVVKTARGTKHVPVGKHKYKISWTCDGRSHTAEVSSSNRNGACRKAGVTKKCTNVRISVLRLDGSWDQLAK